MQRLEQQSAEGSNGQDSSCRIQVFLRVRPLRSEDDTDCYGRGSLEVADQGKSKIRVVDGKKEKAFQFDRVFPSDATNEEVYGLVGKPLVEAAVTGFSGILMAYGQTGAGKTHTLMSENGLTTSIVHRMFGLVSRDKEHSYSISCSYLQIYQEKIHDLLSNSPGNDVCLRQHPEKGTYVHNLTECPVHNAEEVARLLSAGSKKLVVAETKMNRQSSRSHTICQLRIERGRVHQPKGLSSVQSSTELRDTGEPPYMDWHPNEVDDVTYYERDEEDGLLCSVNPFNNGLSSTKGKLYMYGSRVWRSCDLAGSERIKKTKAQGERLQEARSINSSLLELGNVINALAKGKTHVPFRNSTLTRLLQDGLQGNSRTNLIVCVSPSVRDVNETLCSIKFGLRAMKVANTAQVHFEVDYEKMARHLAATLERREQEWKRMKNDYEASINDLRRGDQPPRLETHLELEASSSQPTVHRNGCKADQLRNQTKAVLLAELLSLELFYGMEDLLRAGPLTTGHALTADKLVGLTDRELLLHSAETLLELTEQYFTDGRRQSNGFTLQKIQEKVSDHHHENGDIADDPQGFTRHSTPVSADSSYGRKLLKVRNTLHRLKEGADSAAVTFFSHLFEDRTSEVHDASESEDGKRRLYQILQNYVKAQGNNNGGEELTDIWDLESSLCHVLMDKALLNCVLLLDKAEMEGRLRRMNHGADSRLDYSGISRLSPVEATCPSPYTDDLSPCSPLAGGRLTSIDEGVVLESSSDSVNCRAEKLAHGHFENVGVEYASDKSDELQECEKENNLLSQKVKHLESSAAGLKKTAEEREGELNQLIARVADQKQEKQQLQTKLQECQEKLSESAKRISCLYESERTLRCELSEAKRALQETNERNAALNSRLRERDETGKPEEPVWEEKLRTVEWEKAGLSGRVMELERKLRESEVKLTDVKEFERRLRAELCKEMTKKLVDSQTRSRELGETRAREMKQQWLLSQQQESIITGLKGRLQGTEQRNKDLSSKAQHQGMQLKSAQETEKANEEEIRRLKERVCCLEKAELLLKEKAASLESGNRKLLDDSSLTRSLSRAERKLKTLKLDKESLRNEVQSFRENTLMLESQLLKKDQEILHLRNHVVDLKGEASRVDHESRDAVNQRRSEIRAKFTGERQIQPEGHSHEHEGKEAKLRTTTPTEDNVRSLSMDIHCLQGDISRLSQDKEVLEGCIAQLEQQNTRLVEENRFFANRSKTMGDRVRRFSEEKKSISQECIMKNVENETLRTYASLCSDETKSLKAHLSANKTYARELEEKVHNLELELITAKGDVLSENCQTELLEEEKSALQVKVGEASRAVDRVKDELLNLTTSVITSEKELARVLDQIMSQLGAENLNQLMSFRHQTSSTDSTQGCPSFCSDDVGSDAASDVFLGECLLSCALLPDVECFLNSSEVSIVRENKAEILRLHEHLKAKLVFVREFLNHGKPTGGGRAGLVTSETHLDPGLESSSCDSVLSEERRARKRIGNYALPVLGGAEKERLSSLLASRSASQQSVYQAYLELEEQFLQLSNNLVTKEDELCDVLAQKRKLEKTLSDCQQGLLLCDHCAAKDPTHLEESRRLLKARLLSHMEETSRLEAEMTEVLEYRNKLDAELKTVKGQVEAMELRAAQSGHSARRHNRLHSDTDSSCSEDQKPPLPEKQKKTPKKVTFENVEADKVDADTGPQQARKAEDGYSIPPATAGVWQEADMNGCDVDLCELLSSVSMEVPEVEPPKRSSEDLEAAHSAQRLSAYDNLSYKEKLAFVLNHRQGREDVEDGDRNMFLDKPSTHRVFESEAKCRMCGLFGARRTASHADDSYAKN